MVFWLFMAIFLGFSQCSLKIMRVVLSPISIHSYFWMGNGQALAYNNVMTPLTTTIMHKPFC